MKEKLLIICLFLFSAFAFSQNDQEKIQSYLLTNLTPLDLTANDVSDWVIESKATSKTTKITNYYIKQRYQGIELFHALSNVWMKDNQVINIGNRFVKNCAQKVNTTTPQIGVLEALNQAKIQLQIESTFQNQILNAVDTRTFVISNEAKADNIKAKLVYQLTPQKTLLLAWDFYIDVPKQNHMWSVRINALTGKLLEQNDMMISCSFDHENHEIESNSIQFNTIAFEKNNSILETQSGSYRVIPFTTESPNHGPRQLISNPENATASPFGWHDTDGIAGADYTITKGNNVHAFGDIYVTDDPETGISTEGGTSLTFDFPYLGTNVEAFDYLDAATTNLFYMNNIIHDVFYQYGFDEENGNFQFNNYGHSGLDNDHVLAQSQDGGGLNNANFGTPPDGENGRMQMYLWNRKAGANLITINAPSTIAGNYVAFDNTYYVGHINLPESPDALTTNLVIANDGTDETSDACTPLINASEVNGKIVIMRIGVCTTVEKVLNAQNAGAIAVIIAHNNPGNLFIGGIGDFDITIPVISVRKDVGDFLINALATNTLNISLSEPFTDFVNVDGDFDNLVIAHEYGHGITNRLTGGINNTSCLFNKERMSEGWSDWFGLMMQLKAGDSGAERRGIGTFVINQPTTDDGIRTYPYSSDMAVNPHTFADTNMLAVPHGVGSVWAAMLWDLTWAYIDKYGFDSNIYTGNGGNNKVLQLVVDALKLQPCLPSFVDGRDAILAADQAITGGQDYCMIWDVFARRGLGVNASSGDTDDATDQVEDFSVPPPGPNCTLKIDYFQNDAVSVFPNPTSANFTLRINNYSGVLNLQLFDLNGRLIQENYSSSFAGEQQFSTENVASGVYLLKIIGENIQSSKKLIIK